MPLPFRLFGLLFGFLVLVGAANVGLALAGFLLPSHILALVLTVGVLAGLMAMLSVGLSLAVRMTRAEQRRRDQTRRTRVAEMAHELRTPLAVIRGEAEAIADGVHAATPENLNRIRDAAAVIESLVEDLGHLTDAEAGPMPIRRSRVDPGEVVAAALDALADTARAAGVRLQADLAPGLGPAEWDGARVRRALQNLVANAIRHSPAGSTVTVSAAPERGGVTLTVADQGPGFEPALLPRAFERGVRDAASPGSGLGLAIASEIAEAHGGRAQAANEPGGAVVRLWLPAGSG